MLFFSVLIASPGFILIILMYRIATGFLRKRIRFRSFCSPEDQLRVMNPLHDAGKSQSIHFRL